ncbi:TPA: DUF2695 domain-containing protein [Streptococcus pyogenes]|nr:DUF2695 domain-containing protein [Priestia megaterium]MBN8436413.1 DUF2695 domain-containing protein [Priestia flexa]MCE4093266.1 DUF2695 domain-containing protein [Priestia megaterium]HES8074056.1 DUF2695 domain-containing protein [Streptococcus pyogenes]
MDSLLDLKDELIKGQKLAMQGSYQRRAPSKKAIPHLLAARKGLKEYVKQYSNDALAWQLLSQAEEYLLNYNAALTALQNALSFDKKDKKLLKRLALLKEYASKWQELDMTPEQLQSLEIYLQEKLEICGCDHTLVYTREWLDISTLHSKKSKIVKALQNQGGFCDCEVLMNVID